MQERTTSFFAGDPQLNDSCCATSLPAGSLFERSVVMLTTKRIVIGQVLVCCGCCCGAVDRGRPEVPVEWIKNEWRRRGLLNRLQLTISGRLARCDVSNVIAIVSDGTTHWYGKSQGDKCIKTLWTGLQPRWGFGRLLDVPRSLADHTIDPFRKGVM